MFADNILEGDLYPNSRANRFGNVLTRFSSMTTKQNIREVGTMEIKGIGGVYSAYKTTKTSAPKKASAAVPAKNNTDRVEFGFAAAIAASPIPVFPEVGSMITEPSLSKPFRSASSS